jgi:uncharacterized protein with von Willebrand factor type A (vWA) domain
MPSHFSETTGEIIVACDTSGSMYGTYPVVFGEVARICENLLPEAVRVIWWEGSVVGEQLFTPNDYASIGKILNPTGGGGTRLSCVAEYITEKKYMEKAEINAAKMRASLRRLQWGKAKEGNVTMMIWLGKQILGQKDRMEETIREEVVEIQRIEKKRAIGND